METIWRPKQILTEEQKKAKLQKDSEYEIAHLNLTADFRAGKIIQADFEIQHTKQWNGYVEWSITNGLYEEVTLEEQFAEVEAALVDLVKKDNLIRTDLKKPLIEVKEKVK